MKHVAKRNAKPAGRFSFEEMVWRSDAGLVDQARTELTSIRDDVEFERQLLLIRIARTNCSLGNGQLLSDASASDVRELLQKLLASLFCVVVRPLDLLFRLRKKFLRFIQIPTVQGQLCEQ
jgi:hypothetical protein